ncbi:hypothetical protein V8C40DRAFT_27413 [Trichoderma camerunense]
MSSMALLALGAFRPELFQWRLCVLFVVSCCAAFWGSWYASTHQNIAPSYPSIPYHWTLYQCYILRYRYQSVTFLLSAARHYVKPAKISTSPLYPRF